LDVSCGVSYRTYSAYKSHVYRHHALHLYSTHEIITSSNIISNNDLQHNNQDFNGENDDPYFFDDHAESDSLNSEDEEDNHYTTLLASNNNREKNILSMLDVKRSYISFILQLREEFFLPKKTTNVISTYRVSHKSVWKVFINISYTIQAIKLLFFIE
jgi:hypothetical protein